MPKANLKSIIAPKVHRLSFGMIHCLFRYSTDAGTSSWLWRFNPLLLRLTEKFPFSSLFAQLLGFSIGFGPASAHRSHSGVCSSPRQDGVKRAADSVALAPSAQGEGGVQNAGWACGSRGRRDVATTWGMPFVLLGKLSLDHGTVAVAGCTGSQEGRCG